MTLDRLRASLADRYRIERELGSGGMATVYLAEDLRHSRKVAIKVLREDLAASMGPHRFLREIQIAAQLQHPNILPLLDSGEADGRSSMADGRDGSTIDHRPSTLDPGPSTPFLYYVMPYVPGQSLRERLAREGELPVHEAVRLLCEVTDALAHAHQMGVVHRDVKPDNVMLSGRHALVTDFGVAKAISEATGRNTVTTLGVALGTPTYMSPEQAAADPNIDHRSDIYAVGVMAYEMLTGRPPFTGATPQQVLAAHVTEAPDAVSKRRPAIAPALEEIVMRCLAKRPADRYQSAEELLHLLEAQATPSTGITPTQTRPTAAAHSAQNRWVWVLPVTVAVATALAASLWVLARRDDAPPPIEARRTQVTFTGTADFTAALSPDGQQVAYADRRCGADYACAYDLVVQDVGGRGAARVLEGLAAIYDVTWSGNGRMLLVGGLHDGNQVAYYSVPTLGGEPPRFVTSAATQMFGTGDSLLIATQTTLSRMVLRATTLADPTRGDSLVLEHPGIEPFRFDVSPTGKWVVAGVTDGAVARVLVFDRQGALRDSVIATGTRVGGFAADDRLVLALDDSTAQGTLRLVEYRIQGDGRVAGRGRELATQLPRNALSVGPSGVTYLAGTTQTNVIAIARDGAGASGLSTRPVASSTGFLSSLMGSDGTYIILERPDPAAPGAVRQFVAPFEGGAERQVSTAALNSGSNRSRTVDGRGLVVLTSAGGVTTITEYDLASGQATPRGTMPDQGDIDGLEALADGSIAWQPDDGSSSIRIRAPDGAIRTVRTPQVVTQTMEDSPDGFGVIGWGFSTPNLDSVVVWHLPPGAIEAQSLVRAVFDYLPGHRWLPDGNTELVINETLATSAFYHLDVARGRLERRGTIPLNFIGAVSFANDGRRLVARTTVPTLDVWVMRWE